MYVLQHTERGNVAVYYAKCFNVTENIIRFFFSHLKYLINYSWVDEKEIYRTSSSVLQWRRATSPEIKSASPNNRLFKKGPCIYDWGGCHFSMIMRWDSSVCVSLAGDNDWLITRHYSLLCSLIRAGKSWGERKPLTLFGKCGGKDLISHKQLWMFEKKTHSSTTGWS